MRPFDLVNSDLRVSSNLEASAGTGKTYNLERIVARLVTEEKLPLSKILVVTYTNKAASELKERIRTLLLDELKDSEAGSERKELLHKAYMEYDEASIYTIHGFCSYALSTFPFESLSRFDSRISEKNSLLEESVRDYFRSHLDLVTIDEYRIFRKKHGSFEDGIAAICSYISAGVFDPGRVILPEDDVVEDMKQAALEFNTRSGDFYQRWKRFSNLVVSDHDLDTIKSTLGIRKNTAFKYSAIIDGLKDIEDYNILHPQLMDHCEDLYRLTTDWLETKMKDGKSISMLPEHIREIINRHDAFFENNPTLDLENLSNNIYEQTIYAGFLKKCILEVNKILEEKKELTGEKSFNDLIENLYRVVVTEKHIPLIKALRNTYSVLLVDEFQDTDQLQWGIFNTLFGESKYHNFFLIGDPKQSIYRFRGADLQIYYAAGAGVNDDCHFSLDTNYRSSKEMVEACNIIFKHVFQLHRGMTTQIGFVPVNADGSNAGPLYCNGEGENPMDFLRIPSDQGDNKIESATAEVRLKYFQAVCAKIYHLLTPENNYEIEIKGQRRRIKPLDIAILLRNNTECRILRDLLLEYNIPALIARQNKLYTSGEAEDMLYLLDALAHPEKAGKIRTALATRFFDYSPGEIYDLDTSGELEDIALRFREWQKDINQGKLIKSLHEILTYRENEGKTGYFTRMLGALNGERGVTNTRHIIENLHKEQVGGKLDIYGLYRRLLELTHEVAETEDDVMRLDKDSQAVQIMTMHTSKGLEFPVVFLGGGINAGMKQSEYYTFFKDGANYVDFQKGAAHKKLHGYDNWEEEKRLYYVAFTRAKSKLYIPLLEKTDLTLINSIYASFCWDELQRLNAKDVAIDIPLFLSDIYTQSGKTKTPVKAGVADCIVQGVEKLVANNPGHFAIDDSIIYETTKGGRLVPELDGRDHDELSCCELLCGEGFIDRQLGTTSYSGIVRSAESDDDLFAHLGVQDLATKDMEEHRDDEDTLELQQVKPDEITPLSISRGAHFGDLVHKLFEEIDFSYQGRDCEIDEIKDLTKRFFHIKWIDKNIETLSLLVCNTLRTRISIPGENPFSLSEVRKEFRKAEIEFYFSLKNPGRVKLRGKVVIFKKDFLKGFVDLTFYHGGKIYIADWKTTWLGPEETDYEVSRLNAAMEEHTYDVQYMFYLSALYLYMQKAKGDTFNYDADIGGVFYFFVRGMNPNKDTNQGIFFNKPDEAEVRAFMEGFIESGGE